MLYSSAVLRSGKPQGITETSVRHSFWHCGLQRSPGATPWVLVPAPILPWLYSLRWVILWLCLNLFVCLFFIFEMAWYRDLSCGVTVKGKWHILIKRFLKSAWDTVSIQKCQLSLPLLFCLVGFRRYKHLGRIFSQVDKIYIIWCWKNYAPVIWTISLHGVSHSSEARLMIPGYLSFTDKRTDIAEMRI